MREAASLGPIRCALAALAALVTLAGCQQRPPEHRVVITGVSMAWDQWLIFAMLVFVWVSIPAACLVSGLVSVVLNVR